MVIGFDRSMFSAGQAYTALSRARKLADVAISHLDWDAFIVDEEAIKEYERLEAIWIRHKAVISGN